MKPVILLFSFVSLSLSAIAQEYNPSKGNLEKRQEFQDMKFGMFIHWGLFSELGDGEWVMNNRGITKKEYSVLEHSFYPVHFDPVKWVATAKAAGMKYIVFVTRHHDGFSLWDTQYSDWKVTNTPYGKDVLKMLAEACKNQGIQLGVYYSLLDWNRNDYPYETGRTGQKSGRTAKSNYASYLQFMKNQLTELLTNYGDILSVWFDGHWDQTNVEGSKDMSSRLDWKYPEIYGLIHHLQPDCLIGNNHHLSPLPGEDFQMFEKDLPGQNKSGLSFQKASDVLPLETCETMNNSWGFNITDNHYKSTRTIIHYLINAAGRNANLLLNVGPQPDGVIGDNFTDTLLQVGKWMNKYGNSIYGTRGNVIEPQDWGVVTEKGNKYYVHILKPGNDNFIFLPAFNKKIVDAKSFDSYLKVKYKQQPEGLFIYTTGLIMDETDTIIELTSK